MSSPKSIVSFPELMTSAEVCEALRISRPTLAAWAKAGLFPSVTLPGGHRRYRREDVEAVLAGKFSVA